MAMGPGKSRCQSTCLGLRPDPTRHTERTGADEGKSDGRKVEGACTEGRKDSLPSERAVLI